MTYQGSIQATPTLQIVGKS